MHGTSDKHGALIALVDEVTRLHGRLKTAFSPVRRSLGIGQSELTVLTAVVAAERPPTVPQIGRSIGSPRQLIQRAANILVDGGLIEQIPNPDHKRAALLVPTKAGIALKHKADLKAREIAAALARQIDLDELRAANRSLAAVRRIMEAKVRDERT